MLEVALAVMPMERAADWAKGRGPRGPIFPMTGTVHRTCGLNNPWHHTCGSCQAGFEIPVDPLYVIPLR